MHVRCVRLGAVLLSGICAATVGADGPPERRHQYVSQERLDGNMLIDGTVYVGRITKPGTFRPWIGDLPTVMSSGPVFPGHRPFNEPQWPNEPVYEFRAGRLIPGILAEGGVFVPDLDGMIIAIEDYPYDPATGRRTDKVSPPPEGQAPTVRRIYNLPGYFTNIPPERQRHFPD